MRDYTIKGLASASRRFFITFKDKTPKGETVKVEFSVVPLSYEKPYHIGARWLKEGYIKEKLSDFWHVSTYVTDQSGNCFGGYNPIEKIKFVKVEKPYLMHTYDFDWVLPATDENMNKLREEIERRAFGEEEP